MCICVLDVYIYIYLYLLDVLKYSQVCLESNVADKDWGDVFDIVFKVSLGFPEFLGHVNVLVLLVGLESKVADND